MIDYTKLRKKLTPDPGAEDVLRLRVGVVDAVGLDGVVDLLISDVLVPGVPVLGGAQFDVGSVVQVLSLRGSMMVIGASGAVVSEPKELTGSSVTLGSTNSTSFTNSLTTTGTHGVMFIAPPSGRVKVEGRATGRHPTVNAYTHLDWEIRTGAITGSGTLVRTAAASTSSVHLSPISNGQGSMVVGGIETGLIPGGIYNACLAYRVDAGTGEFFRRYIAVYPL